MASTTAWERISEAWRLKYREEPQKKQIADLCHVRAPSVTNWDNRGGIGHENARTIARATGARWEYIEHGYLPIRETKADSERFEQLRHLWEHMDGCQREAVLRYAKMVRMAGPGILEGENSE